MSGLHYELGKVRKMAYAQSDYDLAFLTSDLFHAQCEAIADQHRDHVREIGLIDLADSLAKIALDPGVESLPEMEGRIQAKEIPDRLAMAARQVPINVAMCRAYLLWLRNAHL